MNGLRTQGFQIQLDRDSCGIKERKDIAILYGLSIQQLPRIVVLIRRVANLFIRYLLPLLPGLLGQCDLRLKDSLCIFRYIIRVLDFNIACEIVVTGPVFFASFWGAFVPLARSGEVLLFFPITDHFSDYQSHPETTLVANLIAAVDVFPQG